VWWKAERVVFVAVAAEVPPIPIATPTAAAPLYAAKLTATTVVPWLASMWQSVADAVPAIEYDPAATPTAAAPDKSFTLASTVELCAAIMRQFVALQVTSVQPPALTPTAAAPTADPEAIAVTLVS
jgi:hypothetical protein